MTERKPSLRDEIVRVAILGGVVVVGMTLALAIAPAAIAYTIVDRIVRRKEKEPWP